MFVCVLCCFGLLASDKFVMRLCCCVVCSSFGVLLFFAWAYVVMCLVCDVLLCLGCP